MSSLSPRFDSRPSPRVTTSTIARNISAEGGAGGRWAGSVAMAYAEGGEGERGGGEKEDEGKEDAGEERGGKEGEKGEEGGGEEGGEKK